MANVPDCPQCTMPDAVVGDDGYECQTCGFEWELDLDDSVGEVLDANGNVLVDGDNVTIVKELKLDGKTGGVKVGTKIKGIRLVAGDHPIDGKVNGRGLLVKAEFVKKAK